MDKTTLGSSAVLGIRWDFFNAWPGYAYNFIRQGTHLTTDEYVSTLFFEKTVLTTVGGISLTDIIGSSFLAVGGGFSSRIICRLGTAFYLGYLVFEVPQNLALQRFPVAKWIRQAS